MAQEFDNTNRGSIWKNDKKETDKHPDFTGSLNVEGVEYWVSAWKRKQGASDKAPALSFSIKMKDGASIRHDVAQEPRQNEKESFEGFDPEDSIPF